jgi:glutathione S-transferase
MIAVYVYVAMVSLLAGAFAWVSRIDLNARYRHCDAWEARIRARDRAQGEERRRRAAAKIAKNRNS